jgi:hypothetical protein
VFDPPRMDGCGAAGARGFPSNPLVFSIVADSGGSAKGGAAAAYALRASARIASAISVVVLDPPRS